MRDLLWDSGICLLKYLQMRSPEQVAADKRDEDAAVAREVLRKAGYTEAPALAVRAYGGADHAHWIGPGHQGWPGPHGGTGSNPGGNGTRGWTDSSPG
jgi:hypothetical protein